MTELPSWPQGGRLRGDLDGDGYRDFVEIRYARNSLASCGFLLTVKTRHRVIAARIPEIDGEQAGRVRIRDWRSPDGDPYVAAVVRLAHNRQQVVVSRWHGASIANVSLYGIVDGKLVLLHFRPREYLDELSLFGSAGTGNTNARCKRGGPLIVVGTGPASASGHRWTVVKSKYRLVRTRVERVRGYSVTTTPRRAFRLAERWGISVLPFKGCAVTRGRRL